MTTIIGKQIKRARESLKISQTDLGMAALDFGKGDENSAQKVISKIELGQRGISAIELYAIARELKKPLQYFFGQENSQGSDFMCGWDEVSREACQTLKDIIDSKDKFVVPAILSNLEAFKDSIEKNKRLNNLELDVIELKKFNAALSSEPPQKRTGKKKVT